MATEESLCGGTVEKAASEAYFDDWEPPTLTTNYFDYSTWPAPISVNISGYPAPFITDKPHRQDKE